VPERVLAQVLVTLPPAERAQLEQRLSTASKALWQARRALSEPHASETSLAAWRADFSAVGQALAAADAVVAPHAAGDTLGS
jgi:hypothetical protein